MTEDEAKTKWCPAYRVATSGGDPSSTYEMDNRPEGGEPDEAAPHGWRRLPGTTHGISNCIGSACMAWRWGEPAGMALSDGGELFTPPDERRGYCGLAGPVQ